MIACAPLSRNIIFVVSFFSPRFLLPGHQRPCVYSHSPYMVKFTDVTSKTIYNCRWSLVTLFLTCSTQSYNLSVSKPITIYTHINALGTVENEIYIFLIVMIIPLAQQIVFSLYVVWHRGPEYNIKLWYKGMFMSIKKQMSLAAVPVNTKYLCNIYRKSSQRSTLIRHFINVTQMFCVRWV